MTESGAVPDRRIDHPDRDFAPRVQPLLVVLLVASLLVCAALTCAFFLVPFGFVDFPCFASVEDGYVHVQLYGPPLEATPSVQAYLFITTYSAFMSGGGCRVETLSAGQSVDLGDYRISVNGDLVIINDNVHLAAGESWQDSRPAFGLNPWWRLRDEIQLTNEGFVHGIREDDGTLTEFEREVLVVIGQQGTSRRISPVTAAIFGLSLLASLLLTGYMLFVLAWNVVTRRDCRKRVRCVADTRPAQRRHRWPRRHASTDPLCL